MWHGNCHKNLKKNLNFEEIYGCDISKLLISKAHENEIENKYLKIWDATDLPYNEMNLIIIILLAHLSILQKKEL